MATWLDEAKEIKPQTKSSSESKTKSSWLSDAKEIGSDNDEILGIPKTTIEGALDALPFAGALAGGTVGSGLGPVGMVGGAGLGAAGGEALANAIRSGLDLESAPKTTREAIEGPIKEGLWGAAGEGAGQLIAKAPQLIRQGIRSARQVPARLSNQAITPEVIPQQTFQEVPLDRTLKPNATEIISATERLGGKATPGMVSSNQTIQNIENVLSQSPTISGEMVRAKYTPIRQGLQKASSEITDAAPMTPFEAGEQFRKGAVKKIRERVEPLASKFEQIRESAVHIKPNQQSLKRSAQRLRSQDLAEFEGLSQGQAIRRYADMIENAKSLDSLKQLRSSVDGEIGQALNAGDGQLAMALGKVKGSIQRLERREILKSAIESMPTKKQGEKAAKELIDEIKSINKGWRSLMTELSEVAKAGGIKKIGSPNHLIRTLDEMPSEKIADRFFNTKNFKGLRDIKTHLPEEFELLRQHKLGQIAEKSMTKGEIDPVKLVRNLKGIGKESRNLLFGESGERLLSDMETVLNSMPSKVGASDTPRGMAWFQSILSPAGHISREAQSAWNYMRLSRQTSKLKPSQSTPKLLPRAAGYIGVSSLSNDNAKGKGPNRWASDGFEKITQSYEVPFTREELMKDPKKNELLIRASSLSPNSKAMDRIVDELIKDDK